MLFRSLPFSLNYGNVSYGSYQSFIIDYSFGEEISQFFVGGCAKRKARGKITKSSAEKFYQDRGVRVVSDITEGSDVISVDSIEGIYVGAFVIGFGVPVGSQVLLVDTFNNTVTINEKATVDDRRSFLYGGLSLLNSQSNLPYWFQIGTREYSRLKPWEVQGKYLYSLPYFEEPVFNSRNRPISYNESASYDIVEVDRGSFFLTTDKSIASYSMYRPTFGVFSIFPIKTFDFDFFFSEYSYSPVLELQRYFFNQTIEVSGTLELPIDENYKITPQIVTATGTVNATGSYRFLFEGYDSAKKTWDLLSDSVVSSPTATNGFIINTYTPFYRYDEKEHPQKYDDSEDYLIRGSGMRNFERRLITKKSGKEIEKVEVNRFRIKFLGGTGATGGGIYTIDRLNVQKSDFSQDQDLRKFSGFLGLSEIGNAAALRTIEDFLTVDDYLGANLSQQLVSEYDRLRENFTKEYATFSRVVPYVNKWVQEGTDGRDNYYRLNNSRAFGITNLSPDDSVDFAEPVMLSHEFPYLDTVPKDYPIEELTSSRSYMFSSLADDAYEENSWYDLLTSEQLS